jgi:hypothetical protein
MVSSEAQRLRPLGIDVRAKTDPVHWFLNGKDDVRSAYFMEDVATEFQVQGLEVDWACVVWDADFRFVETTIHATKKEPGLTGPRWEEWSFKGDRWKRIRVPEDQAFLKNAYRVLLTRARQGMVIVVPEGDAEDLTRNPGFYDGTWGYLKEVGLKV